MKVRNKEVNRKNFTLPNGEYCGNCIHFNWLTPNTSCYPYDKEIKRCVMLDFKVCPNFHKGTDC